MARVFPMNKREYLRRSISKIHGSAKITIQVIKNIHSGIQNIKPVLDNQSIVRNATKGRGGGGQGGKSKPQEAHVVWRKRFPTRLQNPGRFYRAQMNSEGLAPETPWLPEPL